MNDRECHFDKIKVKGRFPFRIGCTSYVYPADIVENVEKMAPHVDDIELVLFESHDASNIPNEEVVENLNTLAKEHSLTYTIHLPIDLDAGSPIKSEQITFLSQVEKIINTTSSLKPYSYILHFQGIDSNASIGDVTAWQRRCSYFCSNLLKNNLIDTIDISVENLSYPTDWYLPLINDFGFSHCIDIGHLWIQQSLDWKEHLETYLDKTRVIHLHGVSEGKDHISLNKSPIEDIAHVLHVLNLHYTHIVTMELFSVTHTWQSFKVVEELFD